MAANRACRPRMRTLLTILYPMSLANTAAAGDITVRMPVPRAAPVGRIAGRAVVRTRMITGSAVMTAVAIETAAVPARAALFEIPAAPGALAAALGTTHRPGRIAGPRHVTRLAAFFAAALTTTFSTAGTVIRSNRSATGAGDCRQREHDKRAFHLSPPHDLDRRADIGRERMSARAAKSIPLVSAA